MTERATIKAWEQLMSQPVIIWHNGDGESFRLAGCGICRGVGHTFKPYADPDEGWHITAAKGMHRTRQWVRCANCRGVTGNPIDVTDGLPQPVSGYPTDHPAGKCFPCSGVRGPKPRKARETAGSGLGTR